MYLYCSQITLCCWKVNIDVKTTRRCLPNVKFLKILSRLIYIQFNLRKAYSLNTPLNVYLKNLQFGIKSHSTRIVKNTFKKNDRRNYLRDLQYTDLSLCVTLIIDFRNKSASQKNVRLLTVTLEGTVNMCLTFNTFPVRSGYKSSFFLTVRVTIQPKKIRQLLLQRRHEGA